VLQANIISSKVPASQKRHSIPGNYFLSPVAGFDGRWSGGGGGGDQREEETTPIARKKANADLPEKETKGWRKLRLDICVSSPQFGESGKEGGGGGEYVSREQFEGYPQGERIIR